VTCRRSVVLACSLLLGIAACGGVDGPRDGNDSSSYSAAPTVGATETGEATPAETVVSPEPTSSAEASDTATTGPDERDPSVTFDPRAAPIGARVEMRGSGFTDKFWRGVTPENVPFALFLNAALDADGAVTDGNEAWCELMASSPDYWFDIDGSGSFTGYFVVPSSGGCFQQEDGFPIQPGEYSVRVNCHTCEIGRFTVLPG
jgi:hypothetical protein